jgi:hypothetical protein
MQTFAMLKRALAGLFVCKMARGILLDLPGGDETEGEAPHPNEIAYRGKESSVVFNILETIKVGTDVEI